MTMTLLARPAPPRVSAATPGGYGALARSIGMLADPNRLMILSLLSGGERDVTSLTGAMGVAQPTVSHHLALLRSAGMVTSRRGGKHIIYRLDGPAWASGGVVRLDLGSGEGCWADVVLTLAPVPAVTPWRD